MRSHASYLSILMLAGLLSPAFAADAPSAPWIGTWKLSAADGGSCDETYRIRADHTMLVNSAEEVAESRYEVADKPDAKGFYQWSDTVTKNNGKKDCAGATIKLGDKADSFLLFHPSGQAFLMCEKAAMDNCIGPFVRQPGDKG